MCLFFIDNIIFLLFHLKQDIVLAIPASNELKILTNNSAAPGLNLVPLLAEKINWHNLFVRDNCLNNFQKILIHLLKEGTYPCIIFREKVIMTMLEVKYKILYDMIAI